MSGLLSSGLNYDRRRHTGKEQELLLVSHENRRRSSGQTANPIEKSLRTAFPDWRVAHVLSDKERQNGAACGDSGAMVLVREALDCACAEGTRRVVVQPAYLLDGREYRILEDTVMEYKDRIAQIQVGRPLFDSPKDLAAVRKILLEAMEPYDDGRTAICLVGHGSRTAANQAYARLQQLIRDAGYVNYYVGTILAEPSLAEVVAQVKAENYRRVVLRPLMLTAGVHAGGEMAGGQKDSWKAVFEAAGYEVCCVMEGLGELEQIRELFVTHVRQVIEQLPERRRQA